MGSRTKSKIKSVIISTKFIACRSYRKRKKMKAIDIVRKVDETICIQEYSLYGSGIQCMLGKPVELFHELELTVVDTADNTQHVLTGIVVHCTQHSDSRYAVDIFIHPDQRSTLSLLSAE